jgi:hypothetical protein
MTSLEGSNKTNLHKLVLNHRHDMSPRARERKEDLPRSFFGRIVNAFCAEDVSREATQKLAGLLDPLINAGVPTKAAKEFLIEQAVFAFGLEPVGIDEIVDEIPNDGESLKWHIEDIPETQDFVVSPCLRKLFKHSVQLWTSLMLWLELGIGSLLQNYAKNFERSSKAVCRTAIDFMLNECLTVIVSIVVPSWVVFPFTFTSIRKATT